MKQILLLFILFNSFNTYSQRYLTLSITGDEGNDTHLINYVSDAGNNGFNAVEITVLETKVNQQDWTLYDNLVNKAIEKNMKIAFRIHFMDLYTPTAEECINESIENNWMRGHDLAGNFYHNHNQVSFGKQKNKSLSDNLLIESRKNIIETVFNKYGYLQSQGKLLFITFSNTHTQEFEFPFENQKCVASTASTLYDYSNSMVTAFRGWLTERYQNDTNLQTIWGDNNVTLSTASPKIPTTTFESAFIGNDGRDWFRFRHHVLNTYANEMASKIKTLNASIKVVYSHGSVFDELSVRRGTFTFKSLSQNCDGVKINDSPAYNHRFSMDLLRSNLPNKWIMNEVEFPVATNEQQLIDQFIDSFNHGAKLVTAKNIDFINTNHLSIISTVLNTINLNENENVSLPVIGTQTILLSVLLDNGGCKNSNANDCPAYQIWNTNRSGENPLNLLIYEDILCSNILSLTSPNDDISTSSLKKSAVSINASNHIFGTQTTEYKTLNSVTLLPNFKVDNGAVFNTTLTSNPCN